MTNVLIFAASLLVMTAAVLPAADSRVSQKGESNHIAISIDDKPFTDYWFGKRDDRPYVRPFFYPVLAADGTPVTSDQYTVHGGDHPHHQSLWVGQGEVNGADHWSLERGAKSPKQRHVNFKKLGGDTIIEDLQWEGTTGQPILREQRTMNFMVFPDQSRGIEFNLEFTPIQGPVIFGDTKEAGLVSVRVAKAISDHPTLTNSTGAHGEKATWGKPADWCDISGAIDGKEYGIAVFDAPTNPRHPTRWHVREYGLLSANPFGLSYFDKGTPRHTGDFPMQPGKPVTFRYLVVVHEGDAAAAKLDEKYKRFANSGEASASP